MSRRTVIVRPPNSSARAVAVASELAQTNDQIRELEVKLLKQKQMEAQHREKHPLHIVTAADQKREVSRYSEGSEKPLRVETREQRFKRLDIAKQADVWVPAVHLEHGTVTAHKTLIRAWADCSRKRLTAWRRVIRINHTKVCVFCEEDPNERFQFYQYHEIREMKDE